MQEHEHVIMEIARERERQMTAEGFQPKQDDGYVRAELARAAMGYVQAASVLRPVGGVPPPSYWPFGEEWWKPEGARRNLVKAAALIVAEIERLDRAQVAADKAS